MYSRIPYLNNSWSSWATHRFYLRHLLYYIAVWLVHRWARPYMLVYVPVSCNHKTLTKNYVTINLISYRCSPWCNHMDNSFVSYHFIYLMAQSAPYWWDMFFTQQTSCLPYVFLIYSSWYIGIYTIDTLLYSLRFTNCIIPFFSQLSSHPQVFTWSCNLSYSSRS